LISWATVSFSRSALTRGVGFMSSVSIHRMSVMLTADTTGT